jgi:hypothetical protein
MKAIATIFSISLIIAFTCCRPPLTGAPSAQSSPPDSLLITVKTIDLSENTSGNDEILIMCYVYLDSSKLAQPLFRQKITLDQKNTSRKFGCKWNTSIANQPLLLFLIEQDSMLPISQIDSTVRVSHQAIIQEFNRRAYSGIEKYLGDEDILGVKIIPHLDYDITNIFSFRGRHKLDKYDYLVKLERADITSVK